MFEQLLKRIALTFDRREVPYMVIGGQAVIFHGEPRLTRDIDVTLGIGPTKIECVLEALQDAELRILVEDPEEFARETMVIPCIDPATEIRVDIVLSTSEYERQAIERAQRPTTRECPVCFATVEDLVIHKIIAGRPRDLEDVRSLLLKNPDADTQYIDQWLRSFAEALAQPINGDFRRIQEEIQKKD